jgi:hypothetical protein
MSKAYTLKLTKQELWALSQNYDAAFTDPDARNDIEITVSDKLKKLYQRTRNDVSQSSPDRGCGTPGCIDPNCEYGKGPNLDPTFSTEGNSK